MVNKVNDYRNSQPAVSSPEINWVEFAVDYDSRVFLQASIHRLEELVNGLSTNKILHDYDSFKAARVDYDYSKYKADSNVAGFQTKVNELAQFFNRTGTTNAPPTPPTPPV